MSFTYKAMSEEEIRRQSLIDPGEYNFEVVKATYKVSDAGNPMIMLMLRVWDIEGKERIVYDNLVSHPSFMYKVKHFCDSTGLHDEYTLGKFNENLCPGRTGSCKVEIQDKQPKKDGSGYYEEKNIVKDYISKNINPKQNLSSEDIGQPFKDDEIPF